MPAFRSRNFPMFKVLCLGIYKIVKHNSLARNSPGFCHLFKIEQRFIRNVVALLEGYIHLIQKVEFKFLLQFLNKMNGGINGTSRSRSF